MQYVLPGAGTVSKASANERAEAEYEQFAVRRRAFLEQEGESDMITTLEEVAKSKPRKKGKKPS